MADHHDNIMQPDHSPNMLQKQSGVRRVNNLPVYIGATMLIIFLITMVMVTVDRNQQQVKALALKPEKTESSQPFAKEIAGNHPDGIIEPQSGADSRQGTHAALQTGAALSNSGGSDPGLSANLPASAIDQPLPPMAPMAPMTPISPTPEEELANQIHLHKLQQLDDAIRSKTAVAMLIPNRSQHLTHNESGNNTSSDSSINDIDFQRQIVQHQLAALPATAMSAQNPATLPASADQSTAIEATTAMDRQDIKQFDHRGQSDRWRLDSSPQPPRSRYELRAGFVVPATLISAINSELPGQIMGQVTQNVFDTATGKYLLIPQGARLLGSYSSNISFGQARVLIAWQRIIFPDGKAMDIGAMPGADGAGMTGFNDQVNNHYLRIFGSSFLMSGVVAGVVLSQPPQNLNAAPTVGSAMSQALGLQLGEAAAQLIGKNMNVAPTLEIRPGYRFNIIVTKDLTFAKPYQSFDY